MINTLCLDENYSTTRLLIKAGSDVIANEVKQSNQDKFKTVLFLPEGEGRKGEGGLRTKGYFKKSFEDKPLISIITVVFNGEKFLEETIQSVINQNYDNVEYIIIDGGSTDGTLDIIKKYEDRIDYWVSEKDSGIYDAMNKGIDAASGEWINFMNGGDWFYDNNVLEKVFAKTSYQNIGVIYGDHQVRYPNRKRIAKAGRIKNIDFGSLVSHQSTFILSTLHKKNKYNILNRISADFEFFYKSYKNDIKFEQIDMIISSVSSGGLSDVQRVESIVGWWNIVEKNTKTNLFYIWLIIKEMCKEKIKKVIYYKN